MLLTPAQLSFVWAHAHGSALVAVTVSEGSARAYLNIAGSGLHCMPVSWAYRYCQDGFLCLWPSRLLEVHASNYAAIFIAVWPPVAAARIATEGADTTSTICCGWRTRRSKRWKPFSIWPPIGRGLALLVYGLGGCPHGVERNRAWDRVDNHYKSIRAIHSRLGLRVYSTDRHRSPGSGNHCAYCKTLWSSTVAYSSRLHFVVDGIKVKRAISTGGET